MLAKRSNLRIAQPLFLLIVEKTNFSKPKKHLFYSQRF